MARRYRCPQCRTRRTSFTALLRHCATHGHALCGCGGYHFKHRLGSPCCVHNPMAPVHIALREGADIEQALEIQDDVIWFAPGKPMKEWPNTKRFAQKESS